MKTNIYIKILSFLLLVTTFVVGCKEDENANNGSVKLLSFGPTGVSPGDTIVFIGENLKKVESIELQGASISSASFLTWTSEIIRVKVPAEAFEGKVSLKTADGNVESKTVLSFDVPVTISSITSEARPGANITIKGNFLNWVEVVIVGEDTVDNFVSQSINELVLQVPLSAKTSQITFLTGGTEPLTIKTEGNLIVTLPRITAIAPISVKHTDNLTITGSDLDLVTSVNFGGNKTVTQFISKTTSEIVVAVPVGALNGKLTLKQLSQVDVVSNDELTIKLPIGTSLLPNPAEPGNDNITIIGTNLDLIAKLTLPGVDNPIAASSFINHLENQIVLALPEKATAGPLLYTTIHGYSNTLGVNIVLPGGGPVPLPLVLYDEVIASGGGDWSWEKVFSDFSSKEQFYSGNVAWKFETNNNGGLSAGGITAIDASTKTYFTFSLYGGPGTDGASVSCILNDKWDSPNSVKIVEGKWTTYQIELSKYPTVDKSAINRFALKVDELSSSIIYADRIGFE